jgi:hypothetical protein
MAGTISGARGVASTDGDGGRVPPSHANNPVSDRLKNWKTVLINDR